MLPWSIYYCWCLYGVQDTGCRWRQLWGDKHCGTSIPKSIFILLIHAWFGTNLRLRSKRETTGKWKEKFWMPSDISERHRRELEMNAALEQGVFLKMCGTCTSNFQDVKLFSSLESCPLLHVLLVLSSLDSQTTLPLVLSSLNSQNSSA